MTGGCGWCGQYKCWRSHSGYSTGFLVRIDEFNFETKVCHTHFKSAARLAIDKLTKFHPMKSRDVQISVFDVSGERVNFFDAALKVTTAAKLSSKWPAAKNVHELIKPIEGEGERDGRKRN